MLLFDTAFNPNTEIVNNVPRQNSVNPANRFRTVSARHDKGAVLTFCDGHASYYKLNLITNTVTWGKLTSGEPLNPDIIWEWQAR